MPNLKSISANYAHHLAPRDIWLEIFKHLDGRKELARIRATCRLFNILTKNAQLLALFPNAYALPNLEKKLELHVEYPTLAFSSALNLIAYSATKSSLPPILNVNFLALNGAYVDGFMRPSTHPNFTYINLIFMCDNTLVAAANSGEVDIWDVPNKRLLNTIAVAQADANIVLAQINATHVRACFRQNGIKCIEINVKAGEVTNNFTLIDPDFNLAAGYKYSSNFKMLIAKSAYINGLVISDLETGKKLCTFYSGNLSTDAYAFDDNNKCIYFANAASLYKSLLPNSANYHKKSEVIIPTSKQHFILSHNNTTSMIPAKSDKIFTIPNNTENKITDITPTAAGNVLLVNTQNSVIIFDTKTNNTLANINCAAKPLKPLFDDQSGTLALPDAFFTLRFFKCPTKDAKSIASIVGMEATQREITLTEFKKAYTDKYASEFFKNPFSKMKRMLASGEVQSMSQVEAHASQNNRTAGVLTELKFKYKK